MAIIDFGGVKEEVVTREEFPVSRALEVLRDETIAVIGYGVQGPAQALNMKDNGFNVIVGQAKRFEKDWQRAIEDGWVPGETLVRYGGGGAAGHGGADAGLGCGAEGHLAGHQGVSEGGGRLYFSHGFSIVYKDQTGVVAPADVDVILVAPKGSGLNVRRNFLSGAGINSSFGVAQDYTGRARERAIALGIAVGSGYLFPTSFEQEVYSDLTGERGVLMGALAGLMEAQYEVLRAHGHSPSEAFNETVEELTQSLIRLVDENGMDWMYANCSATAQRGALDWKPRFKEASLPVFKELYERVKDGSETRRVLSACGADDYQETLGAELAELGNSELWRAGRPRAVCAPRSRPGRSRRTPRVWEDASPTSPHIRSTTPIDIVRRVFNKPGSFFS